MCKIDVSFDVDFLVKIVCNLKFSRDRRSLKLIEERFLCMNSILLWVVEGLFSNASDDKDISLLNKTLS